MFSNTVVHAQNKQKCFDSDIEKEATTITYTLIIIVLKIFKFVCFSSIKPTGYAKEPLNIAGDSR